MKKENNKKNNKKRIIAIASISALAGVGAIAYIISKNRSKDYLNTYNKSFFKKASDEVLRQEREKVRVEYANSGLNNVSDERFNRLFNMLHTFDREMANRAWTGEVGYPTHTSHGWYLTGD